MQPVGFKRLIRKLTTVVRTETSGIFILLSGPIPKVDSVFFSEVYVHVERVSVILFFQIHNFNPFLFCSSCQLNEPVIKTKKQVYYALAVADK